MRFKKCIYCSARPLALEAFPTQPSSEGIRAVLNGAIKKAGRAPKYTVSDKGGQFWCEGFKRWCKRRGVKPRFGAIGKHGSIALVERFIRSMKSECLRIIRMPLNRQKMRRELALYTEWFNRHRPHEALAGRTPEEAHTGEQAARDGPRFETRDRWPVGSDVKLSAPQGARLELHIEYLDGRKHLPIVTLKAS